MYTTLDLLIVCVLGGLGVGLYIGCVLHFRELCEVKEIADDLQESIVMMDKAHAHTQEDLSTLIDDYASLVTKDEYNGWRNRETWAFVLHIDNDSYHHARAIGEAHRIVREAELDKLPNPEVQELMVGAKMWLGRHFVDAFYEFADEVPESEPTGMREDVGSVWRIDHADIGEWLWELYNTTEVPDEYILPR
jgi:hypothetical protein